MLLGLGLLMGLTSMETASAAETRAPERSGGGVGAGFILGDLDGLSLKFWNGPTHGLQVNLGSASELNSIGITTTYQYHFRPVEVPDRSYSLPFYVGGGGRLKLASTDFTYFDVGLVGVAGMSVLVPGLPVELFVEVNPTVVVYNPALGLSSSVKVGFLIDGGMGIHYYF